MRWGAGRLAAAALTAGLWSGCVETCPQTAVSLQELVRQYNANAAAVPRLWARARIKVTVADSGLLTPVSWGSASSRAAPNGLLLLGKGPDPLGPHDFVLIGREPVGELFRLGSSATEDRYYFWVRLGEEGGAWWGRNDLAGAPGLRGLDIDPHQILSVVGVCELPDDFTQPPTVALSMSTRPCAYVVTYIGRQPVSNRILFRREVYFHWSNTEPLRPFLVNFFAPDGRRIMTAKLKAYRPIDVSGADDPPPRVPIMPTDIEIESIPHGGAEDRWGLRRIHIVLSEMTTAPKGLPSEACRFRPPAGLPVTQVDQGIRAGGPKE